MLTQELLLIMVNTHLICLVEQRTLEDKQISGWWTSLRKLQLYRLWYRKLFWGLPRIILGKELSQR